MLHVLVPNAIVHPWAMVVHLKIAVLARSAVVGLRWLPSFLFAELLALFAEVYN